MLLNRRRSWVYLAIIFLGIFLLTLTNFGGHRFLRSHTGPTSVGPNPEGKDLEDDPTFLWRNIPVRYPVQSMSPLPTNTRRLPKVQARFRKESRAQKQTRLARRDAVKSTFVRCWEAYKANAWMSDEVAPISGGSRNPFGGWGATLVDSLDTLWIMSMRSDFEHAVAAAANISFETAATDEIKVFETNIRYLGGFLSAYDLSGDKRLLRKAKEVGDMLYAAFDTPNRMPIT